MEDVYVYIYKLLEFHGVSLLEKRISDSHKLPTHSSFLGDFPKLFPGHAICSQSNSPRVSSEKQNDIFKTNITSD